MTTQPTDPRPAATEAAMSEGELLLLGALHAYFRGCDLMRSRATFDEVRDVIERYGDGYRLITAAPPSGQVVVDAELVRQASTAARLVANWGDDKHPLDRSYWNGLADRLSALTGADR